MADFHIPTAAVAGGETLIGREIKDLLEALKPPCDVRLVSGDAETSKVARIDEDEAAILAPLEPQLLDDCDVLFLAGSPALSQQALDLSAGRRAVLVDVTGALEDHPRARLRAPQLEPDAERPADTIDVVAHPAAVALAMFFQRISRRWAVQRSLVEVFEPASERGQAGLSELQNQSVNLLSFKPLPKDVYDAQAGFSLLPEFGQESPHKLDEIEARIDRHLATLLLISSRMPMPSLRLIQAPVFHGYSFSIWIEFAEAPAVSTLEEALACAGIEVRRAAEGAPNNVQSAGESGILVGGIRPDRNQPRAVWFWLAADNLRMMAETAVAVGREYL